MAFDDHTTTMRVLVALVLLAGTSAFGGSAKKSINKAGKKADQRSI